MQSYLVHRRQSNDLNQCVCVCVCHYYCTVVHSCEYWLHGLVKGGKLFSVHLLVLGDVLFFQFVCLVPTAPPP